MVSKHQGWLVFSKLNPEVLFGKSSAPRHPRTVFVNQPLPENYYDPKGVLLKNYVYSSNQVVTSKYNVFTFVPRNLLEQFRRIANAFFAAIAILQFFPRFSTISPGLVLIPLLAVLLISAIKDGYEDIKRHQSDRRVNQSRVTVLKDPRWNNPNAMAKKNRTFRSLLPRRNEAQLSNGGRDNSPAGTISRDDSLVEDKSDPGWKFAYWEDLGVGDFVKISNNQQVPADIVICATSEDENVAYVETKNLDGETNLKSRNAVPALTALTSARACVDPSVASFKIETDKPDENMYRLDAKITMADEHSRPQAVDMQTVLLRGTVIRNTRWVIGVVIFTGEDTKVVMNSSGAPSKRSKVEKQMNPQVTINLVLLALMAVACAIVESIVDRKFHNDGAVWTFGEDTSSDNPNIDGFATWANALITFQNVVPISLYISLEVVRSLQAAFIYFDYEIWYEKSDTATLARSWNLADDLGQIDYIFSDKTGTLTQNVMVFRHCAIGGRVYKGVHEADGGSDGAKRNTQSYDGTTDTNSGGESDTKDPVKLASGVLNHFHDDALSEDIRKSMDAEADSPLAAHARTLNGFFTVLALCHTVIAAVDPDSGELEYRAQSPDEAALVQAAADIGFVFRGRDRELLKLRTPFNEREEEYELLNVLEFNSTRKRMSVLVRKNDDNDRRIFLLCKGADNVIFDLLKPGSDEVRRQTETHLEEFANEGLRTLCLAYKVVAEDQYEAWNQHYQDAMVALENREREVEKVSAEIEGDLRLLGATAIEDRLQDGVPETIADLKRAGIKVWVATGDKLETAIAIGYSTNLIARDSNLVVVRGGRHSANAQLADACRRFFDDDATYTLPEPPLRRKSIDSNGLRRTNTGVSSIVGADNGSRPGGFVLVIDGAALAEALEEETQTLLLHISSRCEAVICCRVSPLQKAQIVALVKDNLNAMTLAIGDGANDVSMIQAAHVGIGISGEEGLQAVNSSDYAIAQFRFLKRLILVHGHWSYARNSNMIVNFFYKNIVCIGVLWWYQIHCAWSTQYIFDYTYLLLWNVLWSLASVVAIGIFDRFIDDDVLMALPELYRYGREGKWFGLWTFTAYMMDAVYQSAVIYFICTYSYVMVSARSDGYDVAKVEYSTTMVVVTVMIVNAFNGLNTTAWTNWVFFATTIGPILVWLFTVVYSALAPGLVSVTTFGNNHFLFRSALYWLNIPLIMVLALLPRYLAKSTRMLYWPNDVDILRSARKDDPNLDIWHHSLLGGRKTDLPSNYEKSESEPLTFPPRPSLHSGRSVGSRTDMATGVQSVHRGFDFVTEEDGVSMRRIQSNLSERHAARREGVQRHRQRKLHTGSTGLFPSLRRSLRIRSPPDRPDAHDDD